MGNQTTKKNRQERWAIDIQSDRFFFTREINGRTEESYAPVNKEKAAMFAVAIILGIEPPRLLTQVDQGFQPRLIPHCSDKPAG